MAADPIDHPTWSLDDLADALPPPPPRRVSPAPQPGPSQELTPPPTISSRSKGKQRADPNAPPTEPTTDSWESGSSAHTASSANSITSFREGSILSTASCDRAFDEGACKLWYQRGNALLQLIIVHLEIRTQPRPGGQAGVVIVARSSSGQEIVDDLWNPGLRTNSAPFLENREIAAAMRAQHDATIAAVVHFAPNPQRHPQYSFTSRNDCWDFMQAVVGKTLVASVDIATVKSACTHGNSVESGCETIQVWETRADPSDTPLLQPHRQRQPTSHPTVIPPQKLSRTLKLHRNKNHLIAAIAPVVEIAVTCLRAPSEREARVSGGKLTFHLRDAAPGDEHCGGPGVREMKYLKIAFASDLARDEFLTEVGFGALVGGR